MLGTRLEENATMANNTIKKLLLTGVFALSGAFILSACDDVVAYPVNYDSPIAVKNSEAYEDDANRIGEIYDALTSNKSEKVVSTLLERLALEEFGTYEEIEACYEGGNINVEKAKAHIKKYAHEFIKSYDEEDAKNSKNESATAEQIQLARFEQFHKDLNDRINKVIFDEISSDSYRDTINKTKFLEEKYARAKRQASYDIKGFDEDGKSTIEWKELFIDNSFEEENVREYLTDFTVNYKDYIVRHVVPSVYKDKLVEEYILENNYSALGRAYGRKINYVKIDYTEEDSLRIYKLAELFVSEHIDVIKAKGSEIKYSALVNWIKGFEGVEKSSDSVKIKPLAPTASLDEIYGPAKTLEAKCEKDVSNPGPYTIDLSAYGFTSPFKYYEKTKLGAILKNFEKAVVAENSRFADSEETSALNDFTDNGKRSKEQGLMQKITDLALENYSKDGWFVKNDKDGSLSALPDSIKNRIFNIKIANHFDLSAEDFAKIAEEDRYFKEVQGHRYITPADKSDAKYNYILGDNSAKSLYIVEILEAPSTSKLNKSQQVSYLKTNDNVYKTEEVARQIAKILGTKETYTTNAYTSYLELYTFVYHDTSVYEYLKSTYPDLFEED